MIDCLPTLLSVATAAATSVTIFKFLRPKFSIKVNCWFCNKNTVVPYGNRNCWDCPSCEQYNGFAKDGSYNKPIPAQYDEGLNHPASGSPSNSNSIALAQNSLCDVCNRNQLLKIKQLSLFVPSSQESEDDELEAYKCHLEKTYSICARCRVIIWATLSQQDTLLKPKVLRWMLQQKRKISAVSMSRLRPKLSFLYIHGLRIITVCLAVLLLLGSIYHHPLTPLIKLYASAYLPPSLTLALLTVNHWADIIAVIGFFLFIVAVLSSGKERLKGIDAFGCFAWLLLFFCHAPSPFTDLFSEKLHRQNIQIAFTLLCLVLTTYTIFCKRPLPVYSNIYKKSWPFSNHSPSSLSATSLSSLDDTTLSYNSYPTSVPFNSTSPFKSPLSQSPISGIQDVLQDNHVSTSFSNPENGCDLQRPCDGGNLDFGLMSMKIGTPQKVNQISGVFALRDYTKRSSPPQSVASAPFTLLKNHALTPCYLESKYNFNTPWSASNSFNWSAGYPRGGMLGIRQFQNSLGRQKSYHSFTNLASLTLGHTPHPTCTRLNTSYSSPFMTTHSSSCPASYAGSVAGDDVSVLSEPLGYSWNHRQLPRRTSIQESFQGVEPKSFKNSSLTSQNESYHKMQNTLHKINTIQEEKHEPFPAVSSSSRKINWILLISVTFNLILGLFIASQYYVSI